MARIARPEELPYGDAVMTRHDNPYSPGDYTITVERADNLIGVTPEFWNGDLLEGHRIDDQTLVLDTAGQYRYRLIGEHADGALLFERITNSGAQEGER